MVIFGYASLTKS